MRVLSPNHDINFFLPLLVIILLCCCAIPTILLLERLTLLQGQERNYLLAVIGFVVVESTISRRIYEKLDIAGWDLLYNKIGELIILIVLTKLGSYWNSGLAALIEDIKSWVDHPHYLLQGITIPLICFVLITWRASGVILRSLDLLSQSLQESLDSYLSRERAEARYEIQSALFLGGIWVLILAGTNLVFDHYFRGAKQISLFMQFGVVGYFLVALILLGYTHYLRKRQEWEQRKVPIPQGLNLRWLAGGILLSTLVLLVSGLLPAISTVAPQMLVTLAGEAFRFLVHGALLVHTLIFSFIIWLSQLFSIDYFPNERRSSAPPELLPEDPVQELQIPSFLIWELIVLILIVIAIYYFRTRAWPPGTLHEKIRLWIRVLWQWMQYLKIMEETLFNLISLQKEKKQSTEQSAPPKEKGLIVHRTPNARIRRHYLAMLRSAEKTSYQRKHPQTPKEYEKFLAKHFPHSHEELETLTETFMQARYSDEDCDRMDLNRVQKAWKQLRGELKNNKDRPKK